MSYLHLQSFGTKIFTIAIVIFIMAPSSVSTITHHSFNLKTTTNSHSSDSAILQQQLPKLQSVNDITTSPTTFSKNLQHRESLLSKLRSKHLCHSHRFNNHHQATTITRVVDHNHESERNQREVSRMDGVLNRKLISEIRRRRRRSYAAF